MTNGESIMKPIQNGILLGKGAVPGVGQKDPVGRLKRVTKRLPGAAVNGVAGCVFPLELSG